MEIDDGTKQVKHLSLENLQNDSSLSLLLLPPKGKTYSRGVSWGKPHSSRYRNIYNLAIEIWDTKIPLWKARLLQVNLELLWFYWPAVLYRRGHWSRHEFEWYSTNHTSLQFSERSKWNWASYESVQLNQYLWVLCLLWFRGTYNRITSFSCNCIYIFVCQAI